MNRLPLAVWAAAAALTLCGSTAAADAGFAGAARQTRSAEGFRTDRDPDSLRDPLRFGEIEGSGRRMPRESKGAGESKLQAFSNGEAWFFDAEAELFYDYDGDGYFHFLRVRFDADSLYADHWVYARLFLSADGEFWEEYHATNDFLIEGSSPDDDYEVETELVSGFPPGLYDVLVELYDADFGDLLADFGPADSSSLSLLPLEDVTFDETRPVLTVSSEGGGGSSDSIALLGLLCALALARRRHLSDAAGSRTRALRSSGRTPRALPWTAANRR